MGGKKKERKKKEEEEDGRGGGGGRGGGRTRRRGRRRRIGRDELKGWGQQGAGVKLTRRSTRPKFSVLGDGGGRREEGGGRREEGERGLADDGTGRREGRRGGSLKGEDSKSHQGELGVGRGKSGGGKTV
ncbi:hypothetical protein NSK_000699 [Nannochloropsis salina CCMP1776]|jgi:hypothetical protein|uniref:Uncharacterized protein n=1 Tax=Nannochloropsis salina CCMP1776 TaxID=1027361 RepID=A0A4D9DA83_9STRA|nr:hypothetical protein NSK_000699 [Nannochloropsis salina CCMP1776]|eukprot:TFJ88350.1 hypothetical protein NSK_000699 [Nannochloropsis salina CCMP1776]